jgi:FtsH-binding integral membrane protein
VRNSTSEGGRRKLKNLSFLAGLGAYVLFLLLLICIAAGLIISFGNTRRPKPLGWITFIAGYVLAVWTDPRWARILPGVFGPAALNGIIILSTGHALNQPTVPFPRWQALIFTVLMFIGSLTTTPFMKIGLSRTDQVACIGLLSCFVAGFAAIGLSIEHWEGPIGAAILAFLGLIWTGKVQGRKVRKTGTGTGFADGHL